MKIKAITFDYWDTLVPIDEEKIKKMREERAKEVVRFLKEKGYDFSYEEVKEISSKVWELYRVNPINNKEVTLNIMVEEILKNLKIRKRKKMVESLVKIYEEYLYKAGLSVDKEVIEVIKILKEKGFKLGIVSNTPGGNVEKKILEDTGISSFFDIMLFSSFEGVRKPHPEIFMKVINFFKIRPEELLHIGDTPELDIEGPLKIGAKAILWNPKGKEVKEDIISINNWKELINFIKCQ
ncbi:MAG: HAD family hydrolase [candidate division WOR-3 bacterium]